MTCAEVLGWILTPKGLATIGLFLDLVGISVLFYFQVDRNHALREDGQISLLLEGNDEGERKKWKLYRKLTVLGFVLLIIGFALQLAGNLVS